jgi:hypothetical protein
MEIEFDNMEDGVEMEVAAAGDTENNRRLPNLPFLPIGSNDDDPASKSSFNSLSWVMHIQATTLCSQLAALMLNLPE